MGKNLVDPDRYYSLISRQAKKLDYLERHLLAVLEECAAQLPPAPSQQSIARWLREKGVPTSGHLDSKSNWVPQTVQDFIFVDGSEPDERTPWQAPSRHDGFLITATRMFDRCGPMIRQIDKDRYIYEQRRLEGHLDRIRSVGAKLRRLFPKL